MIKVEIFKNGEGKISAFSVTGHSGTADRGEDIVCAGVSSLAQAALWGIGEHLHREVDYEVASGKLSMKLKGVPDALTEAVLQPMAYGLREIAKLSPKAVRINERS